MAWHEVRDKRSDRGLSRLLDYEDLRSQARRRLPRSLFDYVDAAADDQVTLERNVLAFRNVEFRPQMGRWIPSPDLRTTVLGTELSMPVLIAPCGGLRLVHPDGDLAQARAAAKESIIHVAAASSGFTLEEISQEPGSNWFQLYRFYHRSMMENLVRRAAAAGYETIVCTVDTPVVGNREKDFRNGFSYNMRPNLRNAVRMAPQLAPHLRWLARYWLDGMPFDIPNTAPPSGAGAAVSFSGLSQSKRGSHSPSWDELAWVRKNWSGHLVVKGLLTGSDAARAVDAGADGIIVSNHGGRQLDGVPSSLTALREVVNTVGADIPVLVDSGIRRGSDVVKAIAFGAKAVLIGRLAIWGLAAGGEAGVRRALCILRSDITRTLQLLGCESIDAINESWLY